MDNIRSRARQQLPSVMLTLLSIVQAIALESFWSNLLELNLTLSLTLLNFTAWMLSIVTLLLIVLVWLVSVSLVMRFEWTPSVTDLTQPFFVGLGQLLLIEAMTPERISAWLAVLALFFLFVYFSNQGAYRRARQDPINSQFFATLQPATWRDHLPNLLYIALLGAWAGWLFFNPGLGWISTIALTVCAAVCAVQLRTLTVFWRISMGQADTAAPTKSAD
ncbi:MAG: hypothetical protein ABJ013_03300 [Halioglobus sp.]